MCAKSITAILAILSLVFSLPALSSEGPTTAFVGATVLPMDSERRLENQTVLVRGDEANPDFSPFGELRP